MLRIVFLTYLFDFFKILTLSNFRQVFEKYHKFIKSLLKFTKKMYFNWHDEIVVTSSKTKSSKIADFGTAELIKLAESMNLSLKALIQFSPIYHFHLKTQQCR